MNLRDNIIIINGEDKTYQVESIKRDGNKYSIRFCNSEKTYYYSIDKVVWLTGPAVMDIGNCRIFVNGRQEKNIETVHLFSSDGKKYYAITYGNGFIRHFSGNEIVIRRSCLTGNAGNVFDYLRVCTGVSKLGTSDEEEGVRKILASIYAGIDFVDETTAASVYLDPAQGIKKYSTDTPLFPFGCNASQERAVKVALSNQLSAIQGPPGTGKTQTILNIIANLVVAGKSVLIVSNNNSATENVLEKLTANGFGFLVAPLGNKEKKEAFIANQPLLNPALQSWRKSRKELNCAYGEVSNSLEKVETIFRNQEKLARCRQELAEVRIEKTHYRQELAERFNDWDVRVSSSEILKISRRLKSYVVRNKGNAVGFVKRIRRMFGKFGVEMRLRLSLDIKDRLTEESIPGIISRLDWLFYIRRIKELESDIENLEGQLSRLDANEQMRILTDNSMSVLKASVARRYGAERPAIASVRDLFNNGESVLADYPVVLSTTFSSRTCFSSDTIFDYVIMDEASQVSIDTGVLALTCARNAVIVGDTRQLPNVTKEEDKVLLEEVRRSYNIPESYNAAEHSFLSSILVAVPGLENTLLREHYRCHPDIINFCNQKFYGGELVIMTKRNDVEKHLFALITVPGQHCRGHYNQREIDAVKLELMPLLGSSRETGIIAPYNSQVEQFRAQIPEIDAATVHKYQGREKDTIIMSVTDDIISEFADNANLLNVAVSRAKDRFCLVVTGNTQERKGNIHDLQGYIKYQQGTVIQSRLRSIFDYLFSSIEQYDSENGSDSEYISENLTYDLIETIRATYPHLSYIKVLRNYPVRYLIRDTSGLSEREAEYATHPSTHVDFLIINRVTKEPLLAIETDGYSYHNERTEQFCRDRMKDKIFENYGLPLLRLSTVGHSEERKIVDALDKTTDR